MDIFRNKNTIKNSMVQEFDVPENLDLLNRWTIPKIEPNTVYKFGAFEKLGLKNKNNIVHNDGQNPEIISEVNWTV